MLHQCNVWDGIEKKAKHPLDEEERVLNVSLHAEGRSNTGEDELEEEDELDEGILGNYRSRHMLDNDEVYVNETKVDIVDSWQDSRVTAVVDKHKAVFQK